MFGQTCMAMRPLGRPKATVVCVTYKVTSGLLDNVSLGAIYAWIVNAGVSGS